MGHFNVLGNWPQKLNSGLLDGLIKHLAMLVQHKIVGRAVEFFVAQRAGLLVVDLKDRILNGLPVLLGLRALHIGITHLIAINQKLVVR